LNCFLFETVTIPGVKDDLEFFIIHFKTSERLAPNCAINLLYVLLSIISFTFKNFLIDFIKLSLLYCAILLALAFFRALKSSSDSPSRCVFLSL
jgi:hypothetical protein